MDKGIQQGANVDKKVASIFGINTSGCGKFRGSSGCIKASKMKKPDCLVCSHNGKKPMMTEVFGREKPIPSQTESHTTAPQ